MPTKGCNATRKPISSVNRLVTFQESCTNQSMLIDVPAGRVRAWDSLYCVKFAEEAVRKRMPGVVRIVGVHVEAEAAGRSRPEPAAHGNPVLPRLTPELEGVLTPSDREAVVHVRIDIRFLLRTTACLIVSVAGRVLQSAAAVGNGRQQIVGIDLGVGTARR